MSQGNENLATEPENKTTATVLCVDDEQNILSALRRLLRPEGYKLVFANNGQEGLEAMEKEPVDLIISDMRMPVMDGARFLTEISQRWPDTVRILLTGYSDISSTIEAINKGNIYKYISKPWEDNDIKLTLRRALEQKNLEAERKRLENLTNKQNEELKDLNTNLELKVKQRTGEIEQTLDMYEEANEELKRSYATTIDVFSNLVSMRGGREAEELRQIAEIAKVIAKEIGMSDLHTEDIYHAALLRDIGKIGLSDELLRNPLTSLKKSDQEKVIKHPIIGQGILMALEPLQEVAKLIRCQHERLDGKGYPDGLEGKDIPQGAMILSLLNDFYGLQHGILTEKKFSESEARDFIAKNKTIRYDPKVVDAFLKVVKYKIEKSEDENSRVVRSNGLEENMILAQNLYSSDGVLLLSKGNVITEGVIDRIDNFEKSADEDLDIHIFKDKGDS